MKKLLLLSLVLFIGNGLFAQTSKNVDVVKSIYGYRLVASITYEEKQVVDVGFILMGNNHKYKHIVDLIALYAGTASEVCAFLSEVEKFAEESKDEKETIHTNIHKRQVSSLRRMGIRGLWINEPKGSGYTEFNLKKFLEIKPKLIEWCKKNNVEINCDDFVFENIEEDVVKPIETTNKADKYEQLKKLKTLLDDGILTQEEFDKEKAKILE